MTGHDGKAPGLSFDLGRFLDAQAGIYQQVLAELRAGEKQSHWMWFIFPQFRGLGHSGTARYYAIGSAEEAGAYLRDPVLGARLLECTTAVVATRGRSALEIFGPVDELKFRSSMTLFSVLSQPDSLFQQALDQYFDGRQDERTLALLGQDPSVSRD